MVPPKHFLSCCQHRPARPRGKSRIRRPALRCVQSSSLGSTISSTWTCKMELRYRRMCAFPHMRDETGKVVLGNASLSRILLPSLRPQRTGGTLAAAVTPVMPRTALAEITGVGVLADQVDEPCPAKFVRERPCRGLVTPHQRRVQLKRPRHAEIERGVERPDGLVTAIRIAGIVGLAHAADDVRDAPPVG